MNVQERFGALHEVSRLEAALASCKNELVLSIARDIEDRHTALSQQDVGKRANLAPSAREAARLELAPALGVSSRGAEAALAFAEDMVLNYPKLGSRLAAGEVTLKTARYVGDLLSLAPERCKTREGRAELDSWLAQRAPSWRQHSQGKIERVLAAHYLRTDPEWCHKRRERAHEERSLTMRPASDGMAQIEGYLRLEDAAEIWAKLDQIAHTACTQDGRPAWTRRADALVAAVCHGEHQLHCECGKAVCNAAQRPAPHQKPVELIVQLPTLLGKDEFPAWLEGAPVAPDLARTLAKAANRIRFTIDPLKYVPTQSVETLVKTRDQHCRFPGCSRRTRMEFDHSTEFNHEHPKSGGFTVPENLQWLCKHHHQAKTHGGWKTRQEPDGVVHWTSPTGQKYTTRPGGGQAESD